MRAGELQDKKDGGIMIMTMTLMLTSGKLGIYEQQESRVSFSTQLISCMRPSHFLSRAYFLP